MCRRFNPGPDHFPNKNPSLFFTDLGFFVVQGLQFAKGEFRLGQKWPHRRQGDLAADAGRTG